MREGDPYTTGDESARAFVGYLNNAIAGAEKAGLDTLMIEVPKTPIRVAELQAIAERLDGRALHEQRERLALVEAALRRMVVQYESEHDPDNIARPDWLNRALAGSAPAAAGDGAASAPPDASREATDRAYAERNMLVGALSKLFPAWLRVDPNEPEWPVVVVRLPTGQASWHITQTERYSVFPHLEPGDEPWDGHDDVEKWRRVCTMEAGSRAAMPAEPRPGEALVRITKEIIERLGSRTADGRALLSFSLSGPYSDGTHALQVTRTEDDIVGAAVEEGVRIGLAAAADVAKDEGWKWRTGSEGARAMHRAHTADRIAEAIRALDPAALAAQRGTT